MSALSSVAGLHNPIHTYLEAETETQLFFSALSKASRYSTMTTLRNTQMFLTNDENTHIHFLFVMTVHSLLIPKDSSGQNEDPPNMPTSLWTLYKTLNAIIHTEFPCQWLEGGSERERSWGKVAKRNDDLLAWMIQLIEHIFKGEPERYSHKHVVTHLQLKCEEGVQMWCWFYSWYQICNNSCINIVKQISSMLCLI